MAIKVVHKHMASNPDAVVTFTQEARLAARMSHANITQLFDFGEVDGQQFMAMEYVAGRDMRAVFYRHRKRRRRIPLDITCHLVRDLCDALDYAHNRKSVGGRPLGIVHSDLSLRNLMLSYDGELKLIDFGLAQSSCRTALSLSDQVQGTPAYMSPEQLLNDPVDHRSDMFACGIVMFELLTGTRLFYAKNVRDIIRKVCHMKIPCVRAYNPEIPEELAAIVTRALQRHPDDRWQRAEQLRDALVAFMRRAGFRTSISRTAAWMRDLYAKEYKTESRRIAELWETVELMDTHREPPTDWPGDDDPALSGSHQALVTATLHRFSCAPTTSTSGVIRREHTHPMTGPTRSLMPTLALAAF